MANLWADIWLGICTCKYTANFLCSHYAVTGQWQCGDLYFDLLVALATSYKTICATFTQWVCVIVYFVSDQDVMVPSSQISTLAQVTVSGAIMWWLHGHSGSHHVVSLQHSDCWNRSFAVCVHSLNKLCQCLFGLVIIEIKSEFTRQP